MYFLIHIVLNLNVLALQYIDFICISEYRLFAWIYLFTNLKFIVLKKIMNETEFVFFKICFPKICFSIKRMNSKI